MFYEKKQNTSLTSKQNIYIYIYMSRVKIGRVLSNVDFKLKLCFLI